MAKIKDVVSLKTGYANFVELKSAFEESEENADRMAMYRPTKAHRRAFERISRGLFQPTDKKFYLLSGSYGTGKSHLCLMTANVLSRSSGDPAIAGFYENYSKLDSEAAKRLKNIRKDGRWVICPIVITDAGAVGRIDNGECRQVSLGYETELVPESGTYDGESYDYRQTNIRYNHLALVSRARAGDEAIVHLDAADGVMQEVVEPVKETVIMSKIRLDGIEYDAAPEVLNHIERLTERTGAAEKTAEELELEKLKAQEAADAAAGEKDAAKAELEKLKATSNDEAIRAGVKARVALERTAAQVLGTEAKLDAMNDRDIKVAVVTKVHADAKMDGRSDEYVQARFDAAIEVNSKINAAAVDTARKVLNPVKAVNADELDATAARARMIENLKNAHKGGGAK